MSSEFRQTTPAPVAPARPMYWSIRRELWENRSVYLVPLIVAAVALFGSFVSAMSKMRALSGVDPAKARAALAVPYSAIASVILLTGFVVAFFYCLDALNGERRDRSILFWKSLPVSDRTTVLSKVAIPLVVIPVLTFTLALFTQLVLFTLTTLGMLGSGVNPATLWTRVPLISMTGVMAYGLTAHVLWFAPIYGWLLLVSAWARRAAVLWAVLPVFAIYLFEKMVGGPGYFASMVKYRFAGAMREAFARGALKGSITRFSQLTPIEFLTSAGLWVGLAFAAICIAAAVRLRRHREPN